METQDHNMEELKSDEDLLNLVKRVNIDDKQDGIKDQDARKIVRSVRNNNRLHKSLEAIGDLCREVPHRKSFSKIGDLVPNLAPLVTSSDVEVQRLSARAIGNLCYENAENRSAFHEKGQVIPPLIGLLSSPNDAVQRTAAGALANLASENESVQAEIGEKGGISKLLDILRSENDEAHSMAARALCNAMDLASNHDIFVNAGGFDIFFNFLSGDDEQLHNEFTSLVCNVYENEKMAKILNDRNLLKYLVEMSLNRGNFEDNEEIKQTSMELLVQLSSIPSFGEGFTKIFDVLVSASESGDDAFLKGFYTIFSNLTVNDSRSEFLMKHFNLALTSILKSNNNDVIYSCVLIIGNLARNDERSVAVVNTPGMVEMLVKLINHPSDTRIVHGALGAVRNLAIPAECKSKFVDAGIMKILLDKIRASERPSLVVQYDAVGVLKVLIAGGDYYLDQFATEDGVKVILDLSLGKYVPKELEDEEDESGNKKLPDKRVQYEAARVLVRLCDRENDRITIANGGGIGPISELVKLNFRILQVEGLKALYSFATTEKTKNLLKKSEEITQVINLEVQGDDLRFIQYEIKTELQL